MSRKFPKLWRKSKVIAILKPGKDSSLPKRYRPITLLCHTYKLCERMILNRLNPITEHTIIKKKTGFRAGKSCTNPDKTQTCAFHINNREASRKLNITWDNKHLEHIPYPVYLGVTLDRTLSYKEHIHKLNA